MRPTIAGMLRLRPTAPRAPLDADPTSAPPPAHGRAPWRRSLDTLLANAFARRLETPALEAATTRPWSDPSTLSRRLGTLGTGARLDAARKAYCDALQGIPAEDLDVAAPRLAVDLQLATSLADLFALRPALFGLLARSRSQAEAQACLHALDARFPPPRAAARPARPSFAGRGPSPTATAARPGPARVVSPITAPAPR